MLLLVSLLFISFTKPGEATGDEKVDAGRHPWAGYLAIPNRDLATATGCEFEAAYYSCGGTLVSIPGLPTRRIFLTASHCVNARPANTVDLPVLIHFLEGDFRSIGVCAGGVERVSGVNASDADVYKGYFFWQGPWKGGVGSGNYKGDYALVLLDREVPSTVVPVVPALFNSTGLETVDIQKKEISVVGVAGYGLVGFGTRNDNTLGQPSGFSGSRIKQYVELDILSVQNRVLTTLMIAAQNDPSACYGDSGSTAFDLKTSVIYGVTSAGDMYCRATNTFSRVGTPDFWDWLTQALISDINQMAASTSGRTKITDSKRHE